MSTGTSSYTELIQQVTTLYGLRADIVAAQVEVESGGQPDAFRFEPKFYDRYIKQHPTAKGFKYGPLAACSYGLMQIMLETALEIGYDERPELLFTPRIGLSWGARYLKNLLEYVDGDYEKALAAYNGGLGAISNGKPYRTAAYVTRVESVLGQSLSA